MATPNLLRMDNVGIVVESLDTAIDFFTELGLTLQGRMTIEGEWSGQVTGLANQRVEIAMADVVNYQNIYRLCYIRGPEGILIGLAEQIGEDSMGSGVSDS
ncbi:MAG: hypothetical protein NVV59_11900 [Chitinophagaceae bacterium]|nr:hypothetical protein [Chitinophagaceae bacterium]